jgi:hypothetical protein
MLKNNDLKWIIWSEIGGLVLSLVVYSDLYSNKCIIWNVIGISYLLFMLLLFNNEKENYKSHTKKKRKKKV